MSDVGMSAGQMDLFVNDVFGGSSRDLCELMEGAVYLAAVALGVSAPSEDDLMALVVLWGRHIEAFRSPEAVAEAARSERDQWREVAAGNGISAATFASRLSRGWSLSDAATLGVLRSPAYRPRQPRDAQSCDGKAKLAKRRSRKSMPARDASGRFLPALVMGRAEA